MTGCVVVMGVAGSGKSTVGRALADRLGWDFVDADDHHPAVNVEKMRDGTPLTDDDRWPWLATLRSVIDDHQRRGAGLVLACSALKADYRARLGLDGHRARLVHLDVDPAELRRRLDIRGDHFLPPSLVDSQLDALEPPTEDTALVLDGAGSVETLVGLATSWISGLAATSQPDGNPRSDRARRGAV